MSLYKDPTSAILLAAANQNGIVLEPDSYVLGLPVTYVDPNGVTNTSITITATSDMSSYEGTATVYYTRLDLADLLKYLPQPVLGYGIIDTAGAVNILNQYYGLNFTNDDITPGAVSLVNGVGTVVLTANENSKGWIGTVTLPFSLGNLPLDTYITNKTLDGVMYPNRDATKPFGEMYSYFRDFTDQSSALESITVGSGQTAILASVLSAVTGNSWVDNAPARYSLLGASVVYNGLTKDNPRSNQNYGYVCVVLLSNDCLGLSGELFLHYGLIPLF